ncbi:MAG: sigma-70 family RNA polymerase sigma factor [Gemmatales bacterium]
MRREHNEHQDVFQQWVQPLLEQAAGYAYSIVGNHADAEDAVQEALLKAYRGLHSYDRARSFKGWWFAIVRNCCLDLVQQRRGRPRTVLVEEAHQVAARTAQAAEPLRERSHN